MKNYMICSLLVFAVVYVSADVRQDALDDIASQFSSNLEILKAIKFPPEKTTPEPCCIDGNLLIDLQHGWQLGNLSNVVDVTFTPSQFPGEPCAEQAVVKVNFDRLGDCNGCQFFPACNHTFLRIDIFMSSGMRFASMLNFGDSATNTNKGGDNGTQENDASFTLFKFDGTVYGSEKCNNSVLRELENLASMDVQCLTFWIGNEFTRIKNDRGIDLWLCNECLFALNGQPDFGTGGINEEFYLAFNRVIENTSTPGCGICNVKITWACPWC